jgi:hypothetical protein
MRRRQAGWCLVALAAISACGGSSPQSPSSVPAGASAGAVVTGTVQSNGGGIAASAPVSSLTVEVVGTNLSATTGPLGEFTLSGVPSGPAELRFRATGVDARLPIATLAGGETVRIVVTVSGSSAVLRTEDRSGNGEVRASGTVERLTGTAASFTFLIGTREVRGGSATQFSGQGPSAEGFTRLRNGSRVEARGSLSGEVLVAARVQLRDDDNDDDDDDDNDDEEDEFEGRLTSMTGTAPNLSLVVGGRAVVTNASTLVRRRGDVVGFAALRLQQIVEVETEGRAGSGGALLAEKITIEDDGDADDDDDNDEVRVEGGIAGLSSLASCPSVAFTVAGQAVTTSGSTRFDDVSCSGLANGLRVEVRGVRQANGSIRATRVKRD